jgi:hypothetical protein
MMWEPISESELATLIADAVAIMEPPAYALWNLIRVPHAKWQLRPWGDEGGGFWVVGLIGQQVVWYNDIEEGFNVSRYDTSGEIAEYWCNQDRLNHTILAMLYRIETGKASAKSGPPQPLT